MCEGGGPAVGEVVQVRQVKRIKGDYSRICPGVPVPVSSGGTGGLSRLEGKSGCFQCRGVLSVKSETFWVWTFTAGRQFLRDYLRRTGPLFYKEDPGLTRRVERPTGAEPGDLSEL